MVQSFQKNGGKRRKIDDEMREYFLQWLFSGHNPEIVASPNKRDVVQERDPKTGKPIIDPATGKAKTVQKWFYTFLQRDVYEQAIKPVDAGGFAGFRDVDGNVFISRSSFRKLMPHNVKRMTSAQKSMCGCDVCIDARLMHQALKEWRVVQAKYLDKQLADCEQKIAAGTDPDIWNAEKLASITDQRDKFLEATFNSKDDERTQGNIKEKKMDEWCRS